MRLSKVGLWAIVATACACWSEKEALSATRYHVRLLTSPDQSARLALDFTCNDSAANAVTILNFSHDGTRAELRLSGGPITGAILSGANPADTTGIEGAAFFNEALLQLAPLGTHVDFDIDLTENGPTSARPEDEFAFFYFAGDDTIPYPTADPSGTKAMFAIDVTGTTGGDLLVFSPMTFVPPDILLLNATLVDVAAFPSTTVRLRFSAVRPNPATGSVRFEFAVPSPGGIVSLRVFDAAGRLVAKPTNRLHSPGQWSVKWNGQDARGRPVPAGIYLVQLRMGGQSVVRRLVMTK